MIVCFEGPDNSGKSTLVAKLATLTGWAVQPSEGPEKYPEEINERTSRYNKMQGDWIFDRHPAVSQPIYGLIGNRTRLLPYLVEDFYRTNPLLIYCRSPGTLKGHVVKEHDDPAHLKAIDRNHGAICQMYDDWALKNAHFVYRIGDNSNRLLTAIRSVIS